MAYAFVQQNSADNAAAAATITVALTPTAGNLLVFCVAGDSADTTSIALSDNLGSHNTFSQIGTDLVTASAQRCGWYFAANCQGGATTFTATFSTSTRFRTIYVAEYSGLTASPFLNGTRAEAVNPGSGADGINSGNANATSQPAMVWGFGIDIDGGTTPTAGTGFTSRTGVWSSATCLGRPEDKRITTTGNVAATFTATTGTDDHAAGVGIFAEAAATPTVSGWEPEFPDRFPARPSVSALGVAVAPVLAIALTPLCWSPSFPDKVPARPVPNLATGSAAEPVFVPPAAPAVTPLSWSPEFPDFALRARQPVNAGGMVKPEATLPNPPAPPLSWAPGFPDAVPRPRAALITGGEVEPVAPNPVPSLASWAAAYTDSSTRARRPQVPSGVAAPTLPIPDPPPSIFPLSVSSNGRYLRKKDGTPFLVCADTTWSLFVDLPLSGVSSYFSTLVSQGFNSLMGNAIEHHYTTVKPPKNESGALPFTQRMDGTTYTGSPNGTTGAAGTQGQFASDNYSNIGIQAPDCTFINNSYWTHVETILDAALASNLLVFVWPGYLGFHAGDEGWLQEMVVWDGVTGAGGFTGQSFADPSKSKMWNYGAWLAARWKSYPNIVWTLGGDYGTNTQTLSTQERAAVVSLTAGMKSVAGQQSTLWTAHWDRPCISDDNPIAGVTFDINFGYCDEAVAEIVRRGYSTAAKPSILGEYNYENGLFGGSAPWRKYTWWGFLGGAAGGFYGHEQLWRFDDGSPGSDYTTLLATQARLDAVRQFAFFKSKPWHRLVPNGLGGIGTLITAGGGTASPQSTTYVAAAATAEGDLLLAYLPPDHTGSVTIDMTKLGASITARWFDPANATFTAIGTFANTGTHAFTTPGNNSAGDADWLLVLEAPDAPMPLSWGPSFPDRTLRSSLTLAQVVSGVVEPVAPPPPATIAGWAPDFPDSTTRARQPVNVGGVAAPVATLPDPIPLSWGPSFPDRIQLLAIRPHSGATAPPADTNAGPLTWAPNFPDRAPSRPRAVEGGIAAPPTDTNAAPLDWAPIFPDRAPGRPRITLGGAAEPPSDTNAGPLTWAPSFPDRIPGRARIVAGTDLVLVSVVAPVSPLSWAPNFPDVVPRLRPAQEGGTVAPLVPILVPSMVGWTGTFPDILPRLRVGAAPGGASSEELPQPNATTPTLSWSPRYPDAITRQREAPIVGGLFAPEATIPNPPAPALSWTPGFPDSTRRARGALVVGGAFAPEMQPVPTTPWIPSFPDMASRARGAQIVGGNAAPEAVLPNVPPAPGWAAAYPDMARRTKGAPIIGGSTAPEATLPNPPAPPLSWAPAFPAFAPRALQPVNVGGMIGPEATVPNPPAPPLSWGPEFPDFVPRPSRPINTGGMIGPVAPNLVTPRTTPPGRAPAQLVGHVTTRFVESKQDEDAHLHGTVRRKRDV